MPKLRTVRDAALLAYDDNIISDEEFAILYDLNKSKNFDHAYWEYDKFDLNLKGEDDCFTDFRFKKQDIPRLKNVLQIPDQITCYNDVVCDGTEALCILLRRLAYPTRFSDMIPKFGRAVPQLCMIFNEMIFRIDDDWRRLLENLNQPWLQSDKLELFTRAVHNKGAPLDNVWGFIDGTVRACCRPRELQRTIYNGHKRYHGLKYQSVVTPSGMIANLFGPIEGKRHDSAMLALSGLLPQMQQHCIDTNGNQLCLYGDAAYPLRQCLQAPFLGANLTAQEKDFNASMSRVRVSVEWLFGEIITQFKFNDFKKNLKIGLSPIGRYYRVSALLTNAHSCLYGNISEDLFNISPPILEEYFQ